MLFRITLSFLLAVTVNGYGQSYAPFNANNPKRFQSVNNASDDDYFFYSIETELSGDTTIHNQYLRQSATLIDVEGTSCQGWGGSMQPTADTTWLGRRIKYVGADQKLFVGNHSSETLTFDFGLSLGDSSVFYSDVSGDYFVKYVGLNQEAVLEANDWVKTFEIWKYSGLNNLVSSSLNGFTIKLSENLGLVSFIECHQFPQLENGVVLKGQLNPTLGYYQLTYDAIYPWQTGDTIEVKGRLLIPDQSLNRTSYKVITIQDRVETADSVWIYFSSQEQIFGNETPFFSGAFNISYTSPIVFRKNENISAFPDKTTSGVTSYYQDSVTFCGDRARYRRIGEYTVYCEDCDCFTPYDGASGTGDFTNIDYLSGLGIAYLSVSEYGNWTDIMEAEVIYSSIGGEQCGTFVPLTLGIDEFSINQSRELVKIFNLMGQETVERPNELLIYWYSDGSVEKRVMVK